MDDTEHWIDAGDYSFRLDNDTIIARNAKGRVLKTVPKKAKDSPEYEQLRSLQVYLQQHDVHCGDTIRHWFLKGLPIPTRLIGAVWIDPSWQKYLQDLVVATDSGEVGLLRNANDKELQVVDLDGETISIPNTTAATVQILHPAVMDELDEWREFAVELGVHQGIDQLFRDIYIRPEDKDGISQAVRKYYNTTYEKAAALVGRSRSAGFDASLNSISLDVVEDGRVTKINIDVYAWDPIDEAQLGNLTFVREGEEIAPEDIGPIVWSEAIRMSEYLYAGRKT